MIPVNMAVTLYPAANTQILTVRLQCEAAQPRGLLQLFRRADDHRGDKPDDFINNAGIEKGILQSPTAFD
jgi:hypothetical protein